MSTTTRPRRGEIWWVNLEPTVGSEIRKKRPVVVISSDAINRLRLPVPLPGDPYQHHLNSRAKISQKVTNIAATNGPITKPLMPNRAKPPSVDSSTR